MAYTTQAQVHTALPTPRESPPLRFQCLRHSVPMAPVLLNTHQEPSLQSTTQVALALLTPPSFGDPNQVTVDRPVPFVTLESGAKFLSLPN